jgi:hypothetical protein
LAVQTVRVGGEGADASEARDIRTVTKAAISSGVASPRITRSTGFPAG